MKTLSIHLRLSEPIVARVDKLRKAYAQLGDLSRAQVLRGLVAAGLAAAEAAEGIRSPMLSSAKDGKGKE